MWLYPSYLLISKCFRTLFDFFNDPFQFWNVLFHFRIFVNFSFFSLLLVFNSLQLEKILHDSNYFTFIGACFTHSLYTFLRKLYIFLIGGEESYSCLLLHRLSRAEYRSFYYNCRIFSSSISVRFCFMDL